ncbi:MAG: choice-of-anchor tandem repeat GloVer-containing protein [Candidatus Korobacteraceae bacterium]
MAEIECGAIGGNLYGVTNLEGPQSAGNLFKLTPSGGTWIYAGLHDFAISPSNGAYPHDGPTLDANGNLYGTTSQGGTGTFLRLRGDL